MKDYSFKKIFILLSFISYFVLSSLIVTLTLYLNHSFQKSRVQSQISMIQRLYSNQSFGELNFIAKNLIKNGFDMITIFNQGNEEVFSLGKRASIDLSIQEFFYVDNKQSVYNGRAKFFYDISNVLYNCLLLIICFILLTIPFVVKFYSFILKRQRIAVETERIKQVNYLARRVSHDLRSPLAVINDIVKESHLNKNTLLISSIKRINSIANNLLSRSRSSTEAEVFDLIPLLDSIIQEKNRLHKNVVISKNINLSKCNIEFNMSDFERIISNLLNNAIEEAELINAGHVELEALVDADSLTLKITNPSRPIEPLILTKLNSGEAVSTKKDGNGLGFSSAVKELKAFGHDITISHREGITEVEITMLTHNTKVLGRVILIDDDKIIRFSWLSQCKKIGRSINVFAGYEEAHDFIINCERDAAIFVDFDLGDKEANGVEVLLSLYDKGFRNLFLATGYHPDEFLQYREKFNVVGKEFPRDILEDY